MKIRFKAFIYHLLISATVVAVAMLVVYGLWYRGPFAFVEDVTPITLLLATVDVVMGPVLTFIVFNPGKKSLKFDLALIGILQLGALAYGLVMVHAVRPVYSVYADGIFSTVTKEDYESEEMGKLAKDNPYLRFPVWSPAYIGAVLPKKLDPADRHKIEVSRRMGGGLRLMPRFYVPYESMAADAANSGKRASELDFANPPSVVPGSPQPAPSREELGRMLAELKAFGRPLDRMMLVPLNGSKRKAIVILEDKTGKIVGTMRFAPFW